MKSGPILYKIIIWLVSMAAALIAMLYFLYILPFWGIPFNAQRHTNVPITPAWALECWLWEDDANTADRVDELLSGYEKYDIPVRTILLDSPWSTRYNDFIVDENRYPNPQEWFKKLEDKKYRVVLWMTCMVNSNNKDTAIKNAEDWFSLAKQNGYLVGYGYQVNWWKGTGGFIDYSNPQAINWWRGLQQPIFDLGLDGWKLDGTATFFSSKFFDVPVPYQKTFEGWKTTRRYMDLYYREEYEHGKKLNPEFITLARSIDRPYAHPEGFAPLDAAPVTWVGDQKHTWKSRKWETNSSKDLMAEGIGGIENALRDILLAAKKGYCIIGSDVGGFSGAEIPPRLYIRWAQFSCFCGLFLNGGHGERALWKRSQQELEIIRKFSWLHTELIPYIYSHMVDCHQDGKPLMRPVRGKYHYLFGNDLLVAPIYQDTLANSVTLPSGQWRYFFDDKEVIAGPISFSKNYPLHEFPVYIREGAIIPLNITRSYTGLGDEQSTGYLTFLIYPHGKNQFTVYQPPDQHVTIIAVEQESEKIEIHLVGKKKSHILCLNLPTSPAAIFLDDKKLIEPCDYRFDPVKNKLWIKTDEYVEGHYAILLAK